MTEMQKEESKWRFYSETWSRKEDNGDSHLFLPFKKRVIFITKTIKVYAEHNIT